MGILIGHSLFAQPFFNIYGSYAPEQGQCVQATPDGNFVVGGAKADSALIFKVDPAGNLLWSRCFKSVSGANNFIHHISATPDGYLIGVGNAVVGNALRGKTFLFKMDVDGNLIWKTAATDSRDQWSHRMLPMNDGQYMLFSGIWDLSRTTWADVYTVQVDPATGMPGPNPLFLDLYPPHTYCEEIHGACSNASGAMFATGRVYMRGSANNGMRAFLTRYSPTGGHEWTRYLMFTIQQSARIYGADIALAGDSLILAYYGDINGASSQYSVGLVRADTLGQVAWTKDYRIVGGQAMMSYSVVPMPYGYVITGNYGSGSNNRLFAIAVDGQGTPIWAKSFGTGMAPIGLEKWHSFQAIGVGNDVLLTGTRSMAGSADKDVVLLRLGPTGDTGCDAGVSILADLTITDIPPHSALITPNQLTDVVPFFSGNPITTTPAIEPCPFNLDLGLDQALCNNSVTLSATSGADSYSWSNGSTGATITVSDPGTYWVDALFGCCAYTDTVEVFPALSPTAAFEVSATGCGLSPTLTNTSTAGTNFSWNFGDGGTSTEEAPVHEYAAPGTYTIILTVSNNCGSDQTSLVVVITGGTSTISIQGPDLLCEGTTGTYTVELDDIDTVGILWSTGETTTSIEVAAGGPQILEVEVTDADGCEYAAQATIEEVSGPTAAFSLDLDPCGLEVAPENGSTNADSYSWDFGDGSTSNDEQAVHEYAAPGTYPITLTVANFCGSDVLTSEIELFTAGTFTISGPDTLCLGDAGTYVAFLAGATLIDILWTTGATTNEITFATATDVLLGANATDSNGCSYTGELQVVTSPLPIAGFNFDALGCASTVTFQDASSNAENWTWNMGNGQTSTEPSPTGSYPGSGTFDIMQVVGNDCGADTAVQQLILGPNGALTLAGPEMLCQDELETYTVFLDGAALSSANWSTGQVGTVVEVTFASDGTLGVTVMDDQGCSYSGMLSVEVATMPEASFTTEDDPCGSSVTLHNQSSGAITSQWFFSNGTTSQLPAPALQLENGEVMEVILVVANACGMDSIMGTVEGSGPPALELVAPERLCDDAPFNLALSHPDGLSAIQWSTGDTTLIITTQPEEAGTITVTAINDQGCTLTASYTMHISGDGGQSHLYIPNVFTPNNDGHNEVFAPEIEEGFITLTIFNRWGQVIFETDDPGKSWRGDHKGRPVPDGTYVYLIRWHDACERQNKERLGHVTVLR